jgi:hypothetical protein
MALTSFSFPPPTAWHDPLAAQPWQELDCTVFTQAAVDSALVTMPCSVAKIFNPLDIFMYQRLNGKDEFFEHISSLTIQHTVRLN